MVFFVLSFSIFNFQFSILTGCSHTGFVETDPPPNVVTLRDREYPIERLLWGVNELEYLDGSKDEIISIRVMCDGVGVTIDVPRRLTGQKIALSSRDTSPSASGVYYLFTLSEREDDEYGNRVYCRIQSWVAPDDRDQRDDYDGWFYVDAGNEPGEFLVEWEMKATADPDTILSTAYIAADFEEIKN
jgi:hypothetical protein